MKRRNFLKLAAAATVVVTTPIRALARKAQDATLDARKLEELGLEGVDPYFLDPGISDPAEQSEIDNYMAYLDQISEGQDAIIPRGGRPKRAPTYRFMRWSGDLGDPYGRFKGPLSVKPLLPRATTYQMNAQILGFRAAKEDWPGDYNIGTLSVEIRTRIRGESMTWLYAQQFELFEDGLSSLGLEYIGQRDGVPSAIATDEPNIDLRIQLMRSPKKKGGILGTVLKVASAVTGGIVAGPAGAAATLASPVRVPQMVQEGVAFSQAVFGGTGEEYPLWRSGFTAYSIAEGGSRLGLQTGLWVAIDEAKQVDLRNVYLDDLGGRVAALKDGQELEVNYLVLAVEIKEGPLPDLYYEEPPDPYEYDQDYDEYYTEPGDSLEYWRNIIERGKKQQKEH